MKSMVQVGISGFSTQMANAIPSLILHLLMTQSMITYYLDDRIPK